MSNRRKQRLDTAGALAWLGAGIFGLALASGLAHFAFGIDLLHAQSNGFGLPCLFHTVTGFACPGCGMTRAVLLAGQLQWDAAWRMNPMFVPLAGLCAAGAMKILTRRLSAA